jgi:hypothetical protein
LAETHHQPIKGAPPTKGQHKLCVSIFLFLFLFCSFLVTEPSKTGSTDFENLYIKRRGLAQRSAFWGSQRFQKFPRVHFSQNPPKFGSGIGISSLNKTINNFSTVHAISAQISSIGAARKGHSKFSTERQKLCSRGHFLGRNAPKGDFKPKHAVE